MSLKQYLWFMAVTTVVAYLVLLSVIFYFDPFVSGALALVFFYASLSLALLGTFSIIGFLIRHFFSSQQIAFREVITSFRQAIWLTVLIILSLMLRSQELFNLISVILLIIALAILELYFLSAKPKQNI